MSDAVLAVFDVSEIHVGHDGLGFIAARNAIATGAERGQCPSSVSGHATAICCDTISTRKSTEPARQAVVIKTVPDKRGRK